MRRSSLLLVFASLACDPESAEATGEVIVPILDPAALEPVEAAMDPLAEHRPGDVDCPPGAWGPESGGFEVQTGVCNYAAFDQPLPMDLEAGDEVLITFWHDSLDAPEPATAHVAVWIGDTVLWQDEVDIPSPSGQLEAAITLDEAPPEQARLGFHLHNHGFNSWRWVSLDVVTASE